MTSPSSMTPQSAGPDAEVLALLAISDTVGASGYLRRFPEALRIHTPRTRETALHWVVLKRSESGARFLLERGADVNALDASGGTPLLYAVQHRDDGIVDVLLRAGADVNLQNHVGETPLLFAIEQGRTALCKALLAAGARVEVIAWGGEPAHHRPVPPRTVDAQDLPAQAAPKLVEPRTRATASRRVGLLTGGFVAAIVLLAATGFLWPLATCRSLPGDLGEGRCLGLVARSGQAGRCRVIEAVRSEIRHGRSDAVISGALDGLASAGECADVALLLRQLPADVSRQMYRLVATAFEACLRARPYSENLVARERSTPTFDQAELGRIANASPCN